MKNHIEPARFEAGRFILRTVTSGGKQRIALVVNSQIQCSFDLSEIEDLLAVVRQMAEHIERERQS